MEFKRVNNIVGWAVFLIATAVYVLTLEPTGSFWDCGEFISTSYNLSIPHPPGAPFFLLVGRMFSLLASDVTQVAYWVNMSSALSSSFTVLFLFWSITMIATKLVNPENDGKYSLGQLISIMGAGTIGSLAFAFSDSFWFSSEEAEVYAMSSFFTAFVFWAILKWERRADENDADKWIVLIAYMVGLSIGVHLLNLVVLPALAFVYYFKKFDTTPVGAIVTLVLSAIAIVLVMNGIITGLPSIASKFEVFFVNNLGASFGSGALFMSLLIIAALAYGIYYTAQHAKKTLNVILLSVTFILIGYSSYGIIIIRSQFEPTIDMNNPENIMSFVSYLKREQYGDRPLLFGPVYTAGRPIDEEKVEDMYRPMGEKYEKYDEKKSYKYDPKHMMFLPRVYSTQPHHVEAYKNILGIKSDRKPTFFENISYMISHQIGYFWGRYFMWNFVGRDGSDYGSSWHFISDKAPDLISKDMARNSFFGIPLFLGLLGLYFQAVRDKKNFIIVGMFFFFTGIAIVLFLNQPPVEPRERDYTHVGSFYAFAIWIGLGVLYLEEVLRSVIKNKTIGASLAIIVSALVPGIMIAEGWDDHDRSKRFHSVDSAKNLLESCAPNAILFTGGDNDTYPLWYAQEVEGFRTDVRVCNLSLLNTDWYVEQMRRQSYLSDPLPMSLKPENYFSGTNDVVYFMERKGLTGGVNLESYLTLLDQRHPITQHVTQDGDNLSVFPSKLFMLKVDTAAVFKNISIDEKLKPYIADKIEWKVSGSYIDKKTLAIMDMVVTNQWKRPIYFSTTLSGEDYVGLRSYLQLEGLAYRLIPAVIPGASQGWINSDIMYDNMMKKFHWRNMNDSTVFYDENYKRFPANARHQFANLAQQLILEGDTAKASEVIDRCFNVLPDAAIPYDYYSPDFISLLYKTGKKQQADAMAELLAKRAEELILYYRNHGHSSMSNDIRMQLVVLDGLYNEYREVGQMDKANKYYQLLQTYYR